MPFPLQGLANKRNIWAWISFDVANQSFTLIINTLLFSKFFQDVAAASAQDKNTLWSLVFAGSMLLVVIASPFAGAMADAKNNKKTWLLATGFGCGLLTCMLAFIKPDMLWLAIVLYVPANFLFNLGENFLASFLPQLAPREATARVSGFSWGIAYAAALLMLVLVAVCMEGFQLLQPSQWRPFFVAAGLWFLVFAVPTAIWLREEPAPQESVEARTAPALAPSSQPGAHPASTQSSSSAARPQAPLDTSVSRLLRTLRELPRFQDLAILLLASFFYGGAMAVVVSFASIIASDFGFQDKQLVIFIAVITLSGIAGTLLPTFFQDKLGHKRMTLALLVLWLCTCFFLAFISWRHGTGQLTANWPVWLAGNLLGLGLGSLGSANRAFVSFLTPKGRSAEFFGLWGLTFKLAAILVIPFGIVRDKLGKPEALIVVAGMVLVGFVLTLFVDEKRGGREGTR